MNRFVSKLLIALGLFASCVLPAADFATNQVLKLSPVPDLHGTLAGDGFQVVRSENWPSGLVPLFGVEDEKQFRLQRLPPPGQPVSSEPLFFAMPLEGEPCAADIAGHWTCMATNAQRSLHQPQWELAVEGERIAGRFSQDGEYRVALISGGTFRSNRFELHIEWINDRYELTGNWHEGKLHGQWRQLGEDENGGWSAERTQPRLRLPDSVKLGPLYEWQRGGERRYSVGESFNEAGWQRGARPLCRVWSKP